MFVNAMSVQMRDTWEALENCLIRPRAQPTKLLAWARNTGQASWTHGFPNSNLCSSGQVTRPPWASVSSSVKWEQADLEETRNCKVAVQEPNSEGQSETVACIYIHYQM